MTKPVNSTSLRVQGLSGPVVASLVIMSPALCLGAYFVGGETYLVAMALVLPVISALFLLLPKLFEGDARPQGTGRPLTREAFTSTTQAMMNSAREEGKKAAVFLVKIDDYTDLVEHHGEAALENVARQAEQRLSTALRRHDVMGRWTEDTLSVCTLPQPVFDLEICLQIAGRMARELSEPYSVDGGTIYISASVGFCQLGREVAPKTKQKEDPVITCAQEALTTAEAAAPGAIRAFARPSGSGKLVSDVTVQDAVDALDGGEILPWFQPQISTDTGKITGFEALARWMHPSRGVLAPNTFLPQLEEAGRLPRLTEIMMYNAFTALRAWDQAGADVGQVGVNFSMAELSDPKLVDNIAWELDRFELAPDRLAVEILETVVSKSPDDVITRNINGLSALGCRIDLDDFGTGHASLTSLRRFGVSRIKIDRSFVMKADRDPEQQRMIRAILTLAERLELETLAEGVETIGEHSLLAQLGCTHVQGFGIGRPMPFDQTLTWIRDHNLKLQDPPQIGRASG